MLGLPPEEIVSVGLADLFSFNSLKTEEGHDDSGHLEHSKLFNILQIFLPLLVVEEESGG